MEYCFEYVRKAADRGVERNAFPCVVVEVGDAKGCLWRYSHGARQVKPNALPVDDSTMFDMASVSKMISTTTVALTMIEEGMLSPCDSLGMYWDNLPEKSAKITVQQLMSHTSGIPGGRSIVGFPKENIAEAILTSEDIMNGEGSYIAGTKVSYACLGFIVLGELLEKIGGKSIDQLAQERAFTPLGMTNTTYRPKGENIAATSLEEPVCGIVNDYNARYLVRPVGNAGLFSTAEDCGKYARMLLNNGNPVLSAPTIAAANWELAPFSGEGRCLGFFRTGRKEKPVCDICSKTAFGHTGWTGTCVMVDPELDIYTVILSNRTCRKVPPDDTIFDEYRRINNAAVAALKKER